MLTSDEIIKLAKKGMIRDYLDLKIQVQPAGFDLTVREVFKIKDEGALDFDNKERKIPRAEKLEWEGDWMFLEPGAYKIVYNEIVKIPRDVVAIARPRSSLLRMGAFVATAVWDPGYEGRSESLLVVMNPKGIRLKRNARVVQLIFLRLSGETEGYKGEYKGENI